MVKGSAGGTPARGKGGYEGRAEARESPDLQGRVVRKKPGGVYDGRDLYAGSPDPIDDPVALVQELTQVLLPVLRDHSTGVWELRERLNVLDDRLNEEARVVRRIPGNELCNRSEIGERRGGPAYWNHFSSRPRA